MAAILSTMKAVTISEHGGRDKIQYTESHPVPSLKPGEILVKNSVAGINYIDIYQRTGSYPPPAPFPFILGAEAIGDVVAIEDPNPFGYNIGDRVVWSATGAFAEYTAVSGDKAVKARADISGEDAVGSFVIGMTALSLVEQSYPANPGDTVLVHAAGGGVGSMLCQILKARGATVIATAGDEAKFPHIIANGASHVVNYRAASGPSWVEQVLTLTGGEGVHAVFDSVGKDTWEGSFAVTRKKGKVVFMGIASGPVPPVDLSKYSRRGNISVVLSAFVHAVDTRELLEHYSSRVQELVARGEIKVNKHKTYKMQDVARAQEELEGRQTIGKLLLQIS